MFTDNKKRLGRNSIYVSPVGLGCWGLTGAYGPVDTGRAVTLLHRAMDLGINFLDTADVYAHGENERLLGRAIKDKRPEIVLATKFGYVGDEQGSLSINGRPEYVRQALEASLRRLQTDYIDLYYLHRVDPHTPIGETVGAMLKLQEEGKIRAIGLSEASKHTLAKACRIAPIDALQSEYSLFTQDIEEEILPFCREQQISLVAFSPLGRGMLSDLLSKLDLAETDYRRNLPRFQGEALEKNRRLIHQLKKIAASKGITIPQLALAWLIQRGDNIVPIPGTTNIEHLESNLRALTISLSTEEMEELAFLGRQVRGARHNEENARFFDDA